MRTESTKEVEMSYEWGCNGKGFMNELVLELGTGVWRGPEDTLY